MRYLHAPAYLLRALASNLVRLRARDSIRIANAVALGTGSLSKSDSRKLLAELTRDANRDAPRGRVDTSLTLADFGLGGAGKTRRAKVAP